MANGEAKTTRIELRAEASRARRIQRAARLMQQSVSGFMLAAASARAEDVIANATATVVPAKYFDRLWTALNALSRPNAALVRRARAKRRITQR